MSRTPTLPRARLSLATLLLAAAAITTGCSGDTPTGLPTDDAAQLSASRTAGPGTPGGVRRQSNYAVAYRNSNYAVAYRNSNYAVAYRNSNYAVAYRNGAASK